MMKFIEGTVDEIVEYQARIGRLGKQAEAHAAAPAAPESMEQNVPLLARAMSPNWNEDDAFFIQQFVYSRATNGSAASRLMRYLREVAALGTVIEAGQSERTRDGLTEYLMVRDDGPRRFGAIAYVKPKNVGLSLRLQPQHVEDVKDPRLQLRDVVATQRYAVNCPLVDNEAVDLALDLTKRALDLVRK